MGINLVVDPRGSRDGERKIETRPGMQYVPPLGHCSFAKDKTLAQCLTAMPYIVAEESRESGRQFA